VGKKTGKNKTRSRGTRNCGGYASRQSRAPTGTFISNGADLGTNWEGVGGTSTRGGSFAEKATVWHRRPTPVWKKGCGWIREPLRNIEEAKKRSGRT